MIIHRQLNCNIIFLNIFLIFFCLNLFSQNPKQQVTISKPLDDIKIISGTFGELRKNHFHTGIDFSTKGVTGLPVYSIFDGYVSRIKVSPYGYGRVVYITHPNGLTSVYAHLQEFNILLNDYVYRKQYELESFDFDIKPDPRLFPVKKNDIIGYSGNSGVSSGPHLHFEIRSSTSEKALNPYLFGIPNNDNFPPVIEKLRIYSLIGNSSLENPTTYKDHEVVSATNSYRLKTPDTLTVLGGFVIGIKCFDLLNYNINKTGIYSLTVFVDNDVYFSFSMDSLDFEILKYINSVIDYEEYLEENSRIHKCQVLLGNRLSIYKKVKNFGVLTFIDEKPHKIKIEVCDFNNNCSGLTFYIKNRHLQKSTNNIITGSKKLLYYGVENKFDTSGLSLTFPPKAFYDSLYFELSIKKISSYFYSEIYRIHDKNTPVHGYYKAVFDVKKKINENEKNKLLVVSIDDKNKVSGTFGGVYSNGSVTAQLPKFGTFALVIDSVKPSITPLNVYNGKNIRTQQEIKFKITDNLSGIHKYRCEANNKWLLFEYDTKNSIITYKRDNHLPSGIVEMKIQVEDERGNKNVYNLRLIN